MQTLVIGDIHGCFEEFQDLLDKAGLAEDDVIISLGDCVDRGPGTPAALRYFMEQPGTRMILGNHERKHLRGARQELQLARSQQISRLQFGDEYDQALSFMSSLPLYLELPEALLVHAYFEPGVPVADQHPSVLCGTRGGEWYLKGQYERPWYELYDGEKPLLVGHENYTGDIQPLVHEDRVFGLDTACVTGKALTGLLLPSFRFVSVRSRADHWQQVRAAYPDLAHPPQPLAWDGTDEERLAALTRNVYALSMGIIRALQGEPGYEGLSTRQQAQRFTEKAGTQELGILLQLARLGRLDAALARRILKYPDTLASVRQEVEQRSSRMPGDVL
jgi:hypothetical protein